MAFVEEIDLRSNHEEVDTRMILHAQHTASSLYDKVLHGRKINDVDEMRYHIYCQSGGKMGCEYLPPCRDVLVLHTKRVNYQAKIWRESST